MWDRNLKYDKLETSGSHLYWDFEASLVHYKSITGFHRHHWKVKQLYLLKSFELWHVYLQIFNSCPFFFTVGFRLVGFPKFSGRSYRSDYSVWFTFRSTSGCRLQADPHLTDGSWRDGNINWGSPWAWWYMRSIST